MFSLNTIKKICVLGMALSLVMIALVSPDAKAVVLDSNVYEQYRADRSDLLSKEACLVKDYDDLQRQVDYLNRQNTGHSLTPQINDLGRSLDETYYDLRKVRQDIKSLDQSIL